MSQVHVDRQMPFVAGAVMDANLRVKIASGVLQLAGLGGTAVFDDLLEIGTLAEKVLAVGDRASVILRSAQGSVKMVNADASLAMGVAVYGAASGKISATVSGAPIGVTLEASTAAGDVIEVLRY